MSLLSLYRCLRPETWAIASLLQRSRTWNCTLAPLAGGLLRTTTSRGVGCMASVPRAEELLCTTHTSHLQGNLGGLNARAHEGTLGRYAPTTHV